MTTKFLMILTSTNQMGDAGKATGVWAEEMAVPYYHLHDAGISIELASPRGGAIPIDANSIKADGQHPAVTRMLADATLQQKILHTLNVDDINDPARQYSGVFFPGGHGTMWDLPLSAGVARVVESLFAGKKIISAVCHGPAGLVSVKRADGKSILFGKRVNSFTDAEEEAVGLTKAVPFLLESRVRELGAVFERAPNWQPFAVRDDNLITGQNPQSSQLVAEMLLAALQELTTLKAA